MRREFDVIVIGAGPAGEVLAGRLAERGGRRVAIVERELVGGECSFYACMPSKALLRAGELLREMGRVPGIAHLAGPGIDVEAVLSRRDQVVAGLDDAGQVPWLESRGIELVRSEGRIVGEREVAVGDEVLTAAEAVVIAVGTGALLPPIPGLADVEAWTNREATTAATVPSRLAILGGGVVGVEMAQAWTSLGSSVTVVEAAGDLLPREEPFAGAAVREALVAAGADVRTGVRATAVRREGDGVAVELGDGAEVVADRLLVAIGRRPLTDGLGLEAVGIAPSGPIEVDDELRVGGVPWLYAVGDVNGRSMLTHSAKYQARIAADVILGEGAVATADSPGAPRVVFTDPQVAAIGLTLDDAQAEGRPVVAIDLPTGGTAGGSFHGRGAAGTTRAVIDTDRDVLVGATFVGPEVAELLHAATIAVVGEVPLRRLAHALPAFPTRSELWLKLLEAYEAEGRSLHAGGARAAA